jgi:hypothetical protein
MTEFEAEGVRSAHIERLNGKRFRKLRRKGQVTQMISRMFGSNEAQLERTMLAIG